ncbi:MAG: MFS transporter [Myxococcota bacterium]
MERPPWILPVIVFAQFAGASLWFAGNAVLPDLQDALGVDGLLGLVTSAVQVGFIVGTLISAFSGLADRISARTLFLISAFLGALFNLGVLIAPTPEAVAAARFLTGVCLAGIYPIGMKIAAGWYQRGLGGAMGWLVGALVLGTAFPHFIRGLGAALPWRIVLLSTSGLAVLGGMLLYAFVPDGPHLSPARRFSAGALREVFAVPAFRAAALGYWGHMWELYTVWAFIPAMLAAHTSDLSVSAWSAAIIGAGAVGCVGGGWLTHRLSSRNVAAIQLLISGTCCLLFPLMLQTPTPIFAGYLLIWGITVVGDSPQFSALNARACPPELLGSGLTIVTSIGFALTVVSIEVTEAIGALDIAVPALAVGPVWGLIAMMGSGPGSSRPNTPTHEA